MAGLLRPILEILFQEAFGEGKIINVVHHLVLNPQLDHTQPVIECDRWLGHLLEVLCIDEIHSNLLRGSIVVHEGSRVVKAAEHRDAGTFLECVKPIAFDLSVDWVSSLDPHLNGALPHDHDVAVLHVTEQNRITEVIDLMLDEIHNLVNRVGLQTSEVRYIVHELLPLVHVLIVVFYHVVEDMGMQLWHFFLNFYVVLLWNSLKNASVLINDAAGTFQIGQHSNFPENVSLSEYFDAVFCILK